VSSPQVDCWSCAGAPTLAQSIKNKRPEALARSDGPQETSGSPLTSLSYLPAAFTTLFFLAASLLLGYM
jgi:hypothetical protein